MAKRSRPQVITRSVADRYASRNERIVEFASDAGGGLICLRQQDDHLLVQVYNTDDTVYVSTDKPTMREGRRPDPCAARNHECCRQGAAYQGDNTGCPHWGCTVHNEEGAHA